MENQFCILLEKDASFVIAQQDTTKLRFMCLFFFIIIH